MLLGRRFRLLLLAFHCLLVVFRELYSDTIVDIIPLFIERSDPSPGFIGSCSDLTDY
jgi:hypothetical protein